MLQKVIDYEFNIVQQKIISDYPVSQPSHTSSRYALWTLTEIIEKIPQYYNYNILWIGNDKASHITSLFYCVLLGSLQTNQKRDQAFLKVKFLLYQLCEQYLALEEQKIFVENLCLLPYSKNLTEFLRKNQTFQDVLIKLFHKYKKKNYKSLLQQELDAIEDIKIFSKMFQFITFDQIDEKVLRILIKDCSFYIIVEHQCFFVMEEKNMSPVKKVLSECQEELIYQTYKKRSSKKRKLANSPASPKVGKIQSQEKIGSSGKTYSTPKFYINSINSLENPLGASNQIITRAFKEESSQESMGKNRKSESDNEINVLKYINLKNQVVESPIKPTQIGSLNSSNARTPMVVPRGEASQSLNQVFKINEQYRQISKENYQNPQNIIHKKTPKRDKIIVQSLGANENNNFRRSIPIITQGQREKRSVPQFILEKQKNSRKVSPVNKNLARASQNLNINLAKPRISSKVYVNNNILASPTHNQYLFTYHPQ